MDIDPKDFYAREGEAIDLKKRPTLIKPFYTSKKHYQDLLARNTEDLRELQNVLYASNSFSILIIFQAMDAAGKDSVIKHVMSGVNPQGCQVYSFKHPSAQDLKHDFLWRTTVCLPERGKIGIFNRSYYEEVLIVRVHPEILSAEDIPNGRNGKKTIWQERFRSIKDLEKHLHHNGTRILKFFLHVSKKEQCKRFLERIDDPNKNWKFSAEDIKERKFWKHYMKAYEDALSETSTETAPWYVVPADDKENARLIVSRTIVDTLKKLKLSYPKLDAKRRRELQSMRRLLASKKEES